MGAWSHTIMGNDTVMDAVYIIEKWCGVDYRKEEILTKEILQDHIEEIADKPLMERYLNHAIGAKCLELGVIMPDKLKESIISASKSEISQGCEEWTDPERRKFFLNDFIEKITQANGTPIQLPYEGLFEQLAKARAEGKL